MDSAFVASMDPASSLPAWLRPERDADAAREGLLRCDSPLRQMETQLSTAHPPEADQAAPVAPAAPAGPATAASSKGEASEGRLAWRDNIPTTASSAPPYPTWLSPDLDAMQQLNPGAYAPGQAPARPVFAAAPEQPTRQAQFHLRRAEPGDNIVLMSRNDKAFAQPRRTQARAGAGAGSGAGSGRGAVASAGSATNAVGITAPWGAHSSTGDSVTLAVGEEESGWEAEHATAKLPKLPPTSGRLGLTLAETIYARVATYEPQAQRSWHD